MKNLLTFFLSFPFILELNCPMEDRAHSQRKHAFTTSNNNNHYYDCSWCFCSCSCITWFIVVYCLFMVISNAKKSRRKCSNWMCWMSIVHTEKKCLAHWYAHVNYTNNNREPNIIVVITRKCIHKNAIQIAFTYLVVFQRILIGTSFFLEASRLCS